MATASLSSPSAVPSLNFAAGSRGSHASLPAFIASIGSEIPAGLHFVDSLGEDDKDVAGTKLDDEGSCGEGLPRGDSGNQTKTSTSHIPAEGGERAEI